MNKNQLLIIFVFLQAFYSFYLAKFQKFQRVMVKFTEIKIFTKKNLDLTCKTGVYVVVNTATTNTFILSFFS